MQTLELEDIQGLLIRAYPELEACYLMLRLGQPGQARQWLQELIPQISAAEPKAEHAALQLAFTNTGIFKLVNQEDLEVPFSLEFTEGMLTESRSRILGDRENNDPAHWYWGNSASSPDAVLMLFARDAAHLENQYQEQFRLLQQYGLELVIRLDSHSLPEQKEHFGFMDGISQPKYKGYGETTLQDPPVGTPLDDLDLIMPGEFILGYPNEYLKLPFSPTIKRNGNSSFDIGKNGSYMVFRQLEQDVQRFWNFMFDTVAQNPHLAGNDAVYLASKMIGRSPDGTPIVSVADKNNPPYSEKERNRFLYKSDDSEGMGCPIGSHIRKSNPRDGIDTDPAVSLSVAKRHRILRRGRTYGKPLAADLDPEKMRHTKADEQSRGLYFICFNANISRQFEFIQHTWNNNPKFDGLYNDIDPITGFSNRGSDYIPGEFTIQCSPIRKKVKDIPQFVYVKGGAYFFMPGFKALRFLAAPSG